jgi:hypothetical protein
MFNSLALHRECSPDNQRTGSLAAVTGKGYNRDKTQIVVEQNLKELKKIGKVAPWHSVKSDVHHNHTECNTGNNIESENRRSGTGGKPLCKECKDLS